MIAKNVIVYYILHYDTGALNFGEAIATAVVVTFTGTVLLLGIGE